MESSPLSSEIMLTLLSALVLILVIALPLLPAILIYKIFPHTKIGASGTIGALTWNSSGAFAAYMIVLSAILLSPLERLVSSVNDFYAPTWSVAIKLKGIDANNQPKALGDVEVMLDPELHRVGSEDAVLRLPGINRSDWPIVIFHSAGGSRDLNLASLSNDDISIDHANKHITVLKPIEIRQVANATTHYPPPGSAYINP